MTGRGAGLTVLLMRLPPNFLVVQQLFHLGKENTLLVVVV